MASHPDDDRELLEALGAATAPEELDPRTNDALLEAAFSGVPTTAVASSDPTSAELVAAEALRDALAVEDLRHPDAALLIALRSAFQPDHLTDAAARAALAQALDTPSDHHSTHRSRRLPLWLAGVSAAAAAFALLFFAQEPKQSAVRSTHLLPEPALIAARTTTTMFTAPFETQKTTARIDRIMAARTRELRHNRYLEWRVE